MRFLLERIEKPLAESNSNSVKIAVCQQIQRLVEGHRLVREKATVDLFSLDLGENSSPGAATDLSAHAGAEQLMYAKQIEKLIRRYEPRLLYPSASVLAPATELDPPRLQIAAQLRHQDDIEEFFFSLAIDE